MENFPGIIPEQPDDDDESKFEKKSKKDAKEIIQKASLFELFKGVDEKAEKKTDKNEKSENIEETGEIDLEILDTTEEKIVSEQLVDNRLEQVEAELSTAPEGSEQEASAVGAATFLEHVGAKIDEGEVISDQLLDEATAEAALELGLSPEDINLEEKSAEQAANETIEPSFESVELNINEQAEQQPEQEEDDPAAINVPVTPPAKSPISGVPPAQSFGTTPVLARPGTNAGFGPNIGGSANGAGQASPNVSPSPNLTSLTETNDRHSHLKYVLAGGLLGYLIGRRSGRIKTEKRLLPVQDKLEKQIENMQEKLLIREEAVRRLAISNREQLEHSERHEIQKKMHRERSKRAETLKVYETSVHKKPERIGKFALLPGVLNEKSHQTPKLDERRMHDIAKTINFEHTNLEELYKLGRIDSKELKEIVEEYLRGGRFEKLIAPSLKPEHDSSQTDNDSSIQYTGSDKLETILSAIPGVRQPEELRFGAEKETHIIARVGMVAGAVTAVVLIAAATAMWLLGAL